MLTKLFPRLNSVFRNQRCTLVNARIRNADDLLNSLKSAVPVVEEAADNEWTTRPWYPEGSDPKRCQARKGMSINPENTSVVLFPGEAGLRFGRKAAMREKPLTGKAKDMVLAASDVLNRDIEEEIYSSNRKPSQAALLMESLAAVEEIPDLDSCIACAGFGVGEITALVFSGSLDFLSAVKFLDVREEALRQFSVESSTGLLAVAYGPDSKLGQACLVAQKVAQKKGLENAWCGIAAYLYPHLKVIGGHSDALDFLEKNGAEFNLRACRRLSVSAAWYTPIMKPLVPILDDALKEIEIKVPNITVYRSNKQSRHGPGKYLSPANIQRFLASQVSTPIRWEQTLHAAYERKTGSEFPSTMICGAGAEQLLEILNLVNAKAGSKARIF